MVVYISRVMINALLRRVFLAITYHTYEYWTTTLWYLAEIEKKICTAIISYL